MSELGGAFERMRGMGDPEADRLIEELYRDRDLGTINHLLSTLVRNDDPPSEDLPPSVREYLAVSGRLPSWADRARIEKGEEIFMLYGVTACAVLGHASLPECYVTPSIAEGLARTQELIKQAHRRLLETSQFVLAVMAKGGLDPDGGGRGIRAAQKVRLMHASIRFLILHTPTETEAVETYHPLQSTFLQMRWDVEELGKPINQADLLRTLLTFSFVTLRGWRTLGVTLTPEQENAYIHSWNVIGHVMGLDAESIPQTYAECETVFAELKERWHGDTHAGRLLTAALLELSRSMLPWVLRGLPQVLLLELVGDQTADELGVRRASSFWWFLNNAAIAVLKWINRRRGKLYGQMPSIRLEFEWLSRRLLERVSRLKPEWREDLFEIPDHLAEHWELRRVGDR